MENRTELFYTNLNTQGSTQADYTDFKCNYFLPFFFLSIKGISRAVSRLQSGEWPYHSKTLFSQTDVFLKSFHYS